MTTLDAIDSDKQTILAIDDSLLVLRSVKSTLEAAGFWVATADSAEAALAWIAANGLPHLAIVDLNMPGGLDGFEFCEVVHEYSDLPVVMLTAIDEKHTIVQAIEQYAEDYVTKPFDPNILVARVRRVLSRVGDYAYTLAAQVQVDDHLAVNFQACEAQLNGERVSLTPTETKLLFILMRHAGRPLSINHILRRLWPVDVVYEDRLRVYIHRLRQKIDVNRKEHRYIRSKRKFGYYFQPRDNGN